MSTSPDADFSSPPVAIDPVLHPWDTGRAVRDLQELLHAHGFRLRIDGDFGYITEDAVKVFQHQHGLRVDGVVGAKTWDALKQTIQPGSRLLREGHTGQDVYELQGLLIIHGYPIHRHRIFDAATKEALIAFQKRHKLRADGVVDLVTWNVLRGKPCPPTPPPQTRWFFNFRKWW